MKNIKDRIASRREAIDEASGFGKTKKEKVPSYEDDFDSMVTKDELSAKLDELKKAYKKARSDDEKMSILKKQTEVRAKMAELE